MDDGDTRTAGTPGSTIDGPAGAPGRPDPWRLAAAATGLAVLVNAAAPWRSQHSPIIYGATGGGLGAEGLPLGLVPVAAVVIGLLAVRWWPVLLLAGAALTVPQALVPLVPSLAERPSLTYYIVLAGVPLVLIAVLAAAQECLDAGAVGTGAALAGATVGAGMIGTAVVGAGWLRITGTPAWLPLALALLAVAGGALAVRRTWPAWPPWRDRPGAGGAGRWRFAVLGGLAAALAMLPAFLTVERVAGLLDVSVVSLGRRQYAMVIIVGVAGLVAAALIAAAAGSWAAAATAAAALVQVGVVAPLVLGMAAAALHNMAGLTAAVLGVATGCAAALTRWRSVFAVGASVLAALAMLLAMAATGGEPEKIALQHRWLVGALLIWLLATATTAAVAATARAAGRRGGLPAVLGPIAGAAVLAGGRAILAGQLTAGAPESSQLNGVHHLGTSAAVLMVGAAVVGGIAVAEALLPRIAAARAK